MAKSSLDIVVESAEIRFSLMYEASMLEEPDARKTHVGIRGGVQE
jgi:hypothetical protein